MTRTPTRRISSRWSPFPRSPPCNSYGSETSATTTNANRGFHLSASIAKPASLRVGAVFQTDHSELKRRSTPDRIRELVRRAIHEGAPGYGFILCPTSSFQEWSEASPRYVENYLAYIDEGLQAGRYPISAYG